MKKILLVFFLLNHICLYAQYTVEHATGRLNYTIPLLDVSASGKVFGFSISYTSKGVHKDSPFSSTGFGWQANFSPASITRVIRGNIEDENYPRGMLYDGNTPYRNIAKKESDGESDIFYLNLSGTSVPFYLSNIGGTFVVKFLKPSFIKITCNHTQGEIIDWEVQDTDGTVYTLSSVDKTLLNRKNGSSTYFSVVKSKWEVSQLKVFKKDPVAFRYNYAVEYPVYSSNSRLTSYLSGKAILGLEDSFRKAALNNAISNYSSHTSGMSSLQNKLTEFSGRFDNFRSNYETTINSNSLLTFSTAHVKQILGNYATGMAVLDADRKLLESDINSYEYQNNQYLNSVNAALLESALISPARKSNDFFRQRSYSLISAKLIGDIQFSESEKMTFYYDTLQINSLLGFENSFRRLSRIVSESPDMRRYIYFRYKQGTDILKRVVILGADNKSVIEEFTMEYYDEDDGNVNAFRRGAMIGVNDRFYDFWGYYNGLPDKPAYLYNGTNYLVDNPNFVSLINRLPEAYITPNFSLLPFYDPYSLMYTQRNGVVSPLGPYHYDQADLLKIPVQRTQDYVEADMIQSEYQHLLNRLPHNQHSRALALKSVKTLYGGKTEFDYESNDVYVPDIDSNLYTGGIRIRSVKSADGTGAVSTSSFSYSFKGENNKMQSTGLFEEWGKWSNMEAASYAVLEDNLFYTGNLVQDLSNTGTFYHYVEEQGPDRSVVGYKYPNSLDFYQAVNMMEPVYNTGSIGNLLLAKIYYDDRDRVRSVRRYGYKVFANNIPSNRKKEVAQLNMLFPYVIPAETNGLDSVMQSKSIFRTFYDQASVNDRYNRLTEVRSDIRINYSATVNYNWAEVYRQNNLPPALDINNSLWAENDLVRSYSLVSNSLSGRLVRLQEIQFDDEQPADAGHLIPSLPDTRPYYYERIIAGSSPRRVTEQTFVYESASSPNIKESISGTSIPGEKIVQTFKYLDDYGTSGLPAALTALKNRNLKDIPLETTSYLLRGSGQKTVLGSQLTLFDNNGLVSHQLTLRTGTAPFNESKVLNGHIVFDSRYDTISTLSRYDTKGNLTERFDNKVGSVTLYGYNQTLPVLKFENTDYNTIKNYIGESRIAELSALNNLTPGQIRDYTLNIPEKIPFSVFSYSKGLGVSSYQGPDKTITTNIYDQNGRVKAIVDGHNNTLVSYTFKPVETTEFSMYTADSGGDISSQSLRKVFLMPLVNSGFAPDDCLLQVYSEDGLLLQEVPVILRDQAGYQPIDDPDNPGIEILDFQYIRFFRKKVKFRFIFNRPYASVANLARFRTIETSFGGGAIDIDNAKTELTDSYYVETGYFEIEPYETGPVPSGMYNDIIWLRYY